MITHADGCACHPHIQMLSGMNQHLAAVQLCWLKCDTTVAPVSTRWLPSQHAAHCHAAAAAAVQPTLCTRTLTGSLTTLFCLSLMFMQYITRQIFRIGTARYAEGLWRMRRHGPVIADCTDSEDFPITRDRLALRLQRVAGKTAGTAVKARVTEWRWGGKVAASDCCR